MLITGDAGLGKSRLIAEFCGSLANGRWRIAYGPCLEFARRPYGPILDALARLDTTPASLAPAATKQEQFAAIVERFAAIAARNALVLVIEDLHWADAATLDLLAYLATRLHRMRILVLASFRSDELYPDHPATIGVAKLAHIARAGRIDLGPLAGAELRTFITEALDGIVLPDETRRAIALAGDGNPFFTEELLKSAVERSATHPVRSRGPALPKTVRATLLERLRPFSEAERRVVTQAAVIGRTFSLPLLATTLGTSVTELLPILRRARDFQLVEEVAPAVFRFRHGLTREAIYGDFLGAELQPLHGTIARALEEAAEGERSLEALAFHWWAAGDSARSLRYNEDAGDAAGRVHAHEDAIAFYERALDAAEIAPDVRGSIMRKIADRRQALVWVQEANATYTAAADIFRDAGNYDREAACRVDAAVTAYKLQASDPTAPLEAMLARLDAPEYLARSRVHLGLAWLAASFWFPTRARRHLEQVDPRALEAPDNRLRFHNVSAWVAMTIGDIEWFRREHTARIEAARSSGRIDMLASAHNNGAASLSILGLHREALDNVEQALRIARAERNKDAEENAHVFAAMCYLGAGDLARARAEIEAVPATTENNVTINNATATGAMIGAYLDDQGLIERWFDGFEAVIALAPETTCGAPFAEIMVRRGRHRDAAALLHRAIPECEIVRSNLNTLLAAGRYGAASDRARAREQLARAADAPTELAERHALGLFDALACRRDERSDEATSLARAAAEGFRRLRLPLLEAEALEVAGEPEAALALYRRCGAAYHVRRLETETAIGPESAPKNGQAMTTLSEREREIALRAARGTSNLDIARELFISHKTVEKHLASVYHKLGISSRRQLDRHVISNR